MTGTETPTEAIARIQAKFPRWGAARVLAGIGHPGYGETFAQRVLDAVVTTGCSPHEAVYGRR